MCSMQLLNSTQVPNTLLEEVYKANSEFKEQEKSMLLFICRKTIGWQKDTQWLSLSYISNSTGHAKSHISKTLNGLIKKKAIILEILGKKRIYSLNVSRWGVTYQVTEGYLTGNEGLPNREPIKDTNIKDTNKETRRMYRKEDLDLAELLYGLIKEENPAWYVKPNWDVWAEDIRKIQQIDGRTHKQVEFMIRWSQNDKFWRKNILSPAKLREKFNQLVVEVKARATKGGKTIIT